MRVALLSDVHANLVALDAVLAEAATAGAEEVWHMGDLVGYGPEPAAVIARLRELAAKVVLGNHDAAVAGIEGLEEFNGLAAEAARWTATVLGDEERAWLAALPRVISEGQSTRVHGTLRDPTWEYFHTYEAAQAHFALQKTSWSFVGHTHLPLVAWKGEDGIEAARPEDGATVELGERLVAVNPGGVGQPRDGDPRSCWALLDTATATVTFHRTAYDIAATQARMREHGLPEPLAARLARGR